MSQWLKKVRVAVAVVFIFSISFLFLDFGNITPSGLRTFLVSTQLVPSLTRILIVFSSASIGLFFVLLLTILFGRVYCSTICPLGILQDLTIRFAQRVNRRRRFRFKKPFYTIHYGAFLFTVVFAFSGSLVLLNLFEPFSNYGRLLSNLISPSVVLANNALGNILGLFGLLFLFQIPLLHINVVSVLASLIFLGLVLYLSYNYGRLFCNLLCPAGALLGIISRFSIFKIVIDENNCKECGLCERVCKANCIKSDLKEIDFAACVGCFNCLDGCPTGGMSYKGRWKKTSNLLPIVNEGRREVLKTSILPALGMLLPEIGTDSSARKEHKEFDESHKHPISPPGSISVEHYSSRCTACHLCVSSCPTQVLSPSFLDYGIAGIFQPKMNYAASYCNYDCVVCGQVCPTGAILPLDSNNKKQVQIGKAHFVKDDCIVVTKKKDCGACSEHCPTKAVKMVPYEQRLVIPDLNNEICVGCGACEHACPVQPRKAIYVNSNLVHGTAKKPKSEKIESSFDSKQDFPF
ncbi:MAG: 4Fe-4S dicluster domain-containing protein [Ignavibacteriales bacterium]|nr:4Fe-4S dicluster domain-containing protein [Ignavibacteriales bacterium]